MFGFDLRQGQDEVFRSDMEIISLSETRNPYAAMHNVAWRWKPRHWPGYQHIKAASLNPLDRHSVSDTQPNTPPCILIILIAAL
jgi:hypothetical protein